MQVVDIAVLRDLSGVCADSGSGFMLELLDAYARDARVALERMRACARRGDARRLASEAHRLKGSSGSVGAAALAGACLEMEHSARAGSCAGMEERVERALKLLDITHGHIAEFFRGNIASAA